MYSNPTRWRGFCYDAKDNITNDPNCNGKHRQKMRQEDCTLMPTGSQQLVSELKNRGRLVWVVDRLCCCARCGHREVEAPRR